ncbi:hypothetical protein A2841_00390 [Candidatus Kaiserbacteria bacterium RIFCSPHIGHO2_01_FULL_48_10]|uniref:Uncharacterized protein n=1 Tax=Candidatus Kaiserbacteria bacterium RIFCSPHIGHO2_01_FULL_48_10 TaxID=1798476 RepID=A0A1F6C4Q9_9BACT|nr:MAG: hypothetical protein A2841_00390 [Candidatus Kaiserbacteria bacterium RIFCSPHIGHO2_01_FULL_48_10]
MNFMEYGLLIFFFLGLLLTIGGWKVTFTKDGLEWMYKNEIWKKNVSIFPEPRRERLDRIRGSGVLLLGLIWSVGSLILLWRELFK